MLIDISQEVFSCHVFPGDPAPQRTTLLSIKDGAVCNLTALSMCAHNGTHVDAPYHFIQDGKTIDRIPLDRFVGPCWVSRHEGPVSGQDAAAILDKARENGAEQRILIAGKATVTEEAAQVFAAHGVWLVGNESQTVGPEDAPQRVHEILLGCGTVLLEGLVLRDVAEGRYMLHAAPLNLGGSDGAPCRAYLMSDTPS
jgi:arylformamidase